MLHHIGAMSTVEIKQDLGVAMAPEHDAFSEELVAQAFVVVDLAVERDPGPAVGRRHRLRALGPRIDDREPPVTEPHAPVAGIPFPDSVGPARCQFSLTVSVDIGKLDGGVVLRLIPVGRVA